MIFMGRSCLQNTWLGHDTAVGRWLGRILVKEKTDSRVQRLAIAVFYYMHSGFEIWIATMFHMLWMQKIYSM